MQALYNFGYMIGYGIVAALIMSLALGILIRVWNEMQRIFGPAFG